MLLLRVWGVRAVPYLHLSCGRRHDRLVRTTEQTSDGVAVMVRGEPSCQTVRFYRNLKPVADKGACFVTFRRAFERATAVLWELLLRYLLLWPLIPSTPILQHAVRRADHSYTLYIHC